MNAPVSIPPISGYRPFALADLLCSGVTGPDLMAELHHHFGDVTRAEVFLAVRTAASLWAAEQVTLKAERDFALAEAESARIELDAAEIELDWLRRQVAQINDGTGWLKSPTPPLTEDACA